MTKELYLKAKKIQEEIEQLNNLLVEDFRHIAAITTYNRNNRLEQNYTRDFRISNDLSEEITKVIKDRLNRLLIEMANL